MAPKKAPSKKTAIKKPAAKQAAKTKKPKADDRADGQSPLNLDAMLCVTADDVTSVGSR